MKDLKDLWVEKYRPKTVEDYVFRDELQRKQIQTWIKDKSIPHLLLSGSPGIGKTTMAKMLVNEIGIEDVDVLEVNASRETGIDFIRDRIIPFISAIAWGPFKVVLLDEADRLSPNAQDSLKGIIEEYSSFARFILTCNTPNKVVPALHSRCQQFHFTKLDQLDFYTRVETILKTEKVKYDEEVLAGYMAATYPDLRKCINLVQQSVTENELQKPTKEDAGSSEWKFEMVELFKAGKIHDARKMLCGKLRAEEMEGVFTWLYENITLFGNEETQLSAILLIKQGLVDHTLISDPEINLSATLIRLARLLEKQ